MSHQSTHTADDDDDDDAGRPIAQNPKRGCGHLKQGKGYIRSAPDALDLPAFVETKPHLPYKEGHYRGYRHFPGYQFEMAISDRVEFEPRSILRQDFGRAFGIADGDHIGEMDMSRAHDLIMWVGKTHYEPDEFIEEVRNLGISKAIPITKNQEPPTVVPGWTRCWCLHMNAIDGDRPGLLGYAPLGEVMYTEPEDGHVPKWAQDYEAAGNMVVAQVGDEVSAEATQNHALGDYDGFTLPDDDSPTGARNVRLSDISETFPEDTDDDGDDDTPPGDGRHTGTETPDDPGAVSVEPSPKEGHDVQPVSDDDSDTEDTD